MTPEVGQAAVREAVAEGKLTAEAETAVAALRAALPAPWAVTLRDAPPGRVSVQLDHPLTTPHVVNFADDGKDKTRLIEDVLAHREVRLLADAPSETPNARLIRRLRNVAVANGWSAQIVEVLAAVLADEGVLTDAEGEWLEAAGPDAWGE